MPTTRSMPDTDHRGDGLALGPQILAALRAGQARRHPVIIDLSNPVTATTPRPVRRRRYSAKYPVLVATASGNGRTLLAWCPPCRRQHTHGRHGACPPGSCSCPLHENLHGPGRTPCTCPVGAGDGHRVAHCVGPGSPFKTGGYWLVETPLAKLLWPSGAPRGGPLAEPPPALLAECAGKGMSRAQARRLWAAAVEAASRLGREVAS